MIFFLTHAKLCRICLPSFWITGTNATPSGLRAARAKHSYSVPSMTPQGPRQPSQYPHS